MGVTTIKGRSPLTGNCLLTCCAPEGTRPLTFLSVAQGGSFPYGCMRSGLAPGGGVLADAARSAAVLPPPRPRPPQPRNMFEWCQAK